VTVELTNLFTIYQVCLCISLC